MHVVSDILKGHKLVSKLTHLTQVSKARDVGVNSIVLFPKVPDALKVLTSLKYFVIFLLLLA